MDGEFRFNKRGRRVRGPGLHGPVGRLPSAGGSGNTGSGDRPTTGSGDPAYSADDRVGGPGRQREFMKQLRNWGAVLLLGLLASGRAEAATSTGVSPIHTVDLRVALTGTIAGQVVGNGAPVANAKVRVLDTSHTANSGAGGAFNLTTIPAGAGYVVAVAAPGFASMNLAHVTVGTGTRDLGTITLRALGGHKVIPLVPDLNPAISRVEEGGVAYRYYRVVSVDGKTPAGGVTLLARLAGGAGIIQTGDVAENWPGRDAGVSDADGIVRIGVPSSAVGGAGPTRTVEVLDAGVVVQSFDVRIFAFKHEKVWGHSLEGSVAGKLGVVRVEPGGKLETEVRDFYNGTTAYQQTIERTRSLSGKAGVEANVGSLQLGSVKAGARAGAGGYMNLQWSGKWAFDPDVSDSTLNMEKVYFAFGDILFLGPLGAEFYGKQDAEFLPAETAALFRDNDRRAMAAAGGLQMFESLQYADGVHHALVCKFPIPGPDGKPSGAGARVS